MQIHREFPIERLIAEEYVVYIQRNWLTLLDSLDAMVRFVTWVCRDSCGLSLFFLWLISLFCRNGIVGMDCVGVWFLGSWLLQSYDLATVLSVPQNLRVKQAAETSFLLWQEPSLLAEGVGSQAPKPKTYEFQSGGVISMLESLQEGMRWQQPSVF